MNDEMILVPRAELLAWAKAWLYENDPGDGTDCVTPFDTYLLKSPAEAQPVGEVRLHNGLLYGRLDGDLPVGKKLYVHPPPSAPVGVEDADLVTRLDAIHQRVFGKPYPTEALAQQPATETGPAPCPVCLGFCGDSGPTCSERMEVRA